MKRIFPILFLSCLVLIACTNTNNLSEVKNLQLSLDSLQNILNKKEAPSKTPMYTFLTFQDNNAENAMNFYVELFDNSKITQVQRWGKEGPGEEGRIMHATFNLNGNLFMCSDSPPIHNWDFSPAVSNFVECENEKELERLFSKLSENGTVTMPLNNYGFSQKFGWVIDQFNISWQLNLN